MDFVFPEPFKPRAFFSFTFFLREEVNCQALETLSEALTAAFPQQDIWVASRAASPIISLYMRKLNWFKYRMQAKIKCVSECQRG